MTDRLQREDIEKMSTEEFANTLMDRLRVDLAEAKLDNETDEQFLKFLHGVRLIAKEDPQAVADGFVALSADACEMEEEIAQLNQQIELFKQLLGQKFSLDAMFGGQPEEQN